jgi:protein-disulfide isomerase
MKISKIHIISYAISAIVLIILAIQVYNRYFKDTEDNTLIKDVLLEKREMDIVFGNDSAILSIYVYASYQCEYCRKFFNEVFPLLEKKYFDNNQLNIIFRPTAPILGKERETALKTLVCINKYGNITYLHQLLLSNFRVMFTNEFREMVEGFKDKDSFVGGCIDGTEGKNYLIQNIEEFRKLEFKGTPTFVIGNQVYIGFRTFEYLSKEIDKQLKNKNIS